MAKPKLRKIMLVVEETGERNADGSQPFNVYLAGDKERIGYVPKEMLSAAEFWAQSFLGICMGAMKQSGALQTITKLGDKKDV